MANSHHFTRTNPRDKRSGYSTSKSEHRDVQENQHNEMWNEQQPLDQPQPAGHGLVVLPAKPYGKGVIETGHTAVVRLYWPDCHNACGQTSMSPRRWPLRFAAQCQQRVLDHLRQRRVNPVLAPGHVLRTKSEA